MKLNKIISSVILSIILFSCLAVTAFADVIVYPADAFFEAHVDECTYVNRNYLTNSPDGHVYSYTAPNSGITKNAFPNNEKINIGYSYTDKDGNVWGTHGYSLGRVEWFKISDLSLIYDSKEFLIDHGDEMEANGGRFTLNESDERSLIFFAYPGGELVNTHGITAKDGASEMIDGDVYIDKNGNAWAHFGYLYGYRDIWLCVSNPYNEDIGGFAVEENAPVLKAEPTSPDKIPPNPDNTKALLITGALVIIVVIGTAVIIKKIK